jgi:hypothetical protein
MYLGSALLIIAHLMFALTYLEPRIPIVLLGIAFSLVPAAMWPAVTKIVPTAKLGTAYGFMFSVQNIGLFIFPMLIGYVVDISNPNYRATVSSEQFEMVQQENMRYEGVYLDRKDQPIANKDINVVAVVFDDLLGSTIAWNENHRVTTDAQGEFEIIIGEPETFLNADFSGLNKEYEYYAQLIKGEVDDEQILFEGPFSADENNIFIASLDETDSELLDKTHRGRVRVFAIERTIFEEFSEDGEMATRTEENTVKIWEETSRFFVDRAGQFEVIMGQGRLVYANAEYFGITHKAHSAEIIKPLDYTNPMLVFSLLGFAGLFFAFLLKRDDKTSGYGLELPNKDS